MVSGRKEGIYFLSLPTTTSHGHTLNFTITINYISSEVSFFFCFYGQYIPASLKCFTCSHSSVSCRLFRNFKPGVNFFLELLLLGHSL